MTEIEKLACSRSYEQNIIKLCEEMGELTKAVSKCYENETPATRQAVTEEKNRPFQCWRTRTAYSPE